MYKLPFHLKLKQGFLTKEAAQTNLAGRDCAGDTVRDLLVGGAVLDLLLPLQLPAPDDLPLSVNTS